jgi:hypothetical protein
MNIIELFYLIGFVLCAAIIGWLLGKPFGVVGWVLGAIGGLVLWGAILWCIKWFCNKLVANRQTKIKSGGKRNVE